MSKLFVIVLFAATLSCSQGFYVKKEAPPIREEDADLYLKTISESVVSEVQPIFEKWIQNGPFDMGASYGPKEFFESLYQDVEIITDREPSDAFVRRNAALPASPNVLESLQKHMELFKSCIDQTLAKTVDEVNVKQVQPVFEAIGDQLNKFSKAFEDLTADRVPA